MFCLVFSLTGFFSLFGSPLILESRYQLSRLFNKNQSSFTSQKKDIFGTYLKDKVNLADSQEFSLIIPHLNIKAKINKAIDIADSNAWQSALKTGVAHAQGSSLPDQSGSIYIFGHSTDYPWNINQFNALLYSLKDLAIDDIIAITYQGLIYEYRTIDKQVVESDNLQYLEPTDKNRLVLQTCWPPGTTWKRLVVTAIPVNDY